MPTATSTIRNRITYANVMATVAVLLALCGTAWAASLPKNIVKSRTIKDGEVKTRDILNNDVRGQDVRNDTLTGNDIHERTLVGVGSANALTTTGHSKYQAVAPSVTNAVEADARAAATEILLGTAGTTSIYAKCFVDSGDDDVHAEVHVKTSANNLLLLSEADRSVVNTDTVENERTIVRSNALAGTTDTYASDATNWWRNPDGTEYVAHVWQIAKHGSVAEYDTYLGAGDACAFTLNFEKVA
jgi:hypothetical protein